MNQELTYSSVPRIICSPGASKNLKSEIKKLKISKLLFVTDRGLIELGLATAIIDRLKEHVNVVVFSDVMEDPPQEQIQKAIDMAKESEIDGVIGFGGGSSMDTAKLVALQVYSSQSFEEIYGVDNAKDGRVPLVQIPTTAGTGSEATTIAIVTTPSKEKKGVVTPFNLPDVAILDAENCVTLPQHIIAMTGIDAMVHGIESYTSKIKKNVITDALALKSLQLLFANLSKVLKNNKDIEAWSNMLLGSCLAGMAISNAPVGAVHALAYPLGGHFKVTHGHSNAILLIELLKYNQSECEDLYAELARAIIPDLGTVSDKEACTSLIRVFENLISEMPFPKKLSELGVEDKHIEMLSNDAMKVTRLLQNNPRVMTKSAAAEIYRNIL